MKIEKLYQVFKDAFNPLRSVVDDHGSSVDEIISNPFFERADSDPVYKTSYEKIIASERLSPHHRNFFNLESFDNTDLLSLSNDVVAEYDVEKKTILNFILLEEMSLGELFNGNDPASFYRKYAKLKHVSYDEIFNESDLFLSKGLEKEKILKILIKIMNTPGLYHKFRKEVIAPQDPREVPFRYLIYLVNLMVSLEEALFKDVCAIYRQQPSKTSQFSFLAALSVLEKKPKLVQAFLDVMKNHLFREQGTFENGFLERASNLLQIIDDQHVIVEKLVQKNNQNSIDHWEFNEAILKKFLLLLKEAALVKTKDSAQKLLNEVERFKDEVLIKGALMRGSFEVMKKIKTEDLNNLIEGVCIESVVGGDLIKDEFCMESSENYKHPEQFSVENYNMLVENLKASYEESNPNYLEMLIRKIPEDLQNENVSFVLFKNTGRLEGLAKIKKINEDCYYLGSLYVNNSFQNNFKIGHLLQFILLKGLKGKKIIATCAPNNKNVAAHTNNGWKVVGTTVEKHVDNNGKEIVSEELLSLELCV